MSISQKLFNILRTSSGQMVPILLVHGGAGDITDDRVPGKINGVKAAVRAGFAVLNTGGTLLDAVEAAVNFMEDDENFNAGYGSVLNFDGEVEMDASIMVGSNLSAGAVTIIQDIAHPISLARKIMERTPHVLLGAEGAKKYAKSLGIPILPPGSLVTESAKEALRQFKERGGKLTEIPGKVNRGDVGTVGAIAIDAQGHVVAATSTGGLNGKMVGRVSDTSQLGSGTYADDNIGAVSTTGHGDTIMKVCLAHSIITAMEHGLSANDATNQTITKMTERLKETAGAITLSAKGDIGIGFSSKRMAWAYQKGNELHFGIEHGQDEVEPA